MIQNLFNHQLHRCPCLLPFAPIQHQLLPLECLQQFPDNFLDFLLFLFGQGRVWESQQIEDGSFFLIQLFCERSFILKIEFLGEVYQLGEESFYV